MHSTFVLSKVELWVSLGLQFIFMSLIAFQCSHYMKAMMTFGITVYLKSNRRLLKKQLLWAINTHAPPHILHYIHFSHIYKSYFVLETNLHTKTFQCDFIAVAFRLKGSKPFRNKIRELTWLTWWTKLSRDACFIHFCAKMFLSISCVLVLLYPSPCPPSLFLGWGLNFSVL